MIFSIFTDLCNHDLNREFFVHFFLGMAFALTFLNFAQEDTLEAQLNIKYSDIIT